MSLRQYRGALGALPIIASSLFLLQLARAEPRPLASSSVDYLPMPDSAEWQRIHVAPGGQEVFIPDYSERIVVIDVATDTLARTLAVPNADYITGMGFTPSGRLIVIGESGIFELDPATGVELQSTAAPWSWWGGPVVFNNDETMGFVVGGDEIYLLQLDPLQLFNPPDGLPFADAGLAAQNPSWGADWYRVWDILISPDNDRLYLVGDSQLKVISGLNSSSDYGGLSLDVYTIGAGAWNDQGDDVQLYLSQDGSWLVDSYGDIYDTADMSLIGSLEFAPLHFFNPLMISMTTDETLLFCGGWAGSTTDTSESGEYLLVASMADLTVLDLDNDASNGFTGIKLPEANGWDTNGSYNQHEMQLTPDGTKLYIAAGSSGALVVSLERDPSDFIVPNRGAQGEWVTLSIAGSFAAGSTVQLQRGGSVVAEGQEVSSLPAGGLRLRFDLAGAALGAHDIVVTPPSGSPTLFANAFIVEEVEADVTVDLVGDREFLAVDSARAEVIVESASNLDIEDLIVSLRLGAGTRYRLTLPARVAGGADQVDADFTTAQEGVPEHIWIHRMVAGRDSYSFFLEIEGPAGVPPEDWDVWTEVTVGFVRPSEVLEPWGIFGDLCSFGDALVTAIRKESSRNGHDFSRASIASSVSNVTRDTATNFGASKVTGMVVEAVFNLVGGPVAWAVSVAMDLDACFGFAKKLFGFDSLFSSDPNDKLSASGVDGYVKGHERLRYQILFENQAEATASAQTVVVSDQLDGELVDLSSFTMEGSSHDAVMTADLNRMTGELTVRFDAIDLPPNVTPPEGEGWFTYSVAMKPELASGTEISNQASIVFDLNAPILTSEVVHTVDREPPLAAVEDLPATTVGEEVEVSWSSQESGVGVWSYDVFVSVDDTAYTLWQEATSATSAHYQGNLGEQLAFYAVARDRLGNIDPAKTGADTETLLVEDGPVGVDAGVVPDAGLASDAGGEGGDDKDDKDEEDEGCGCAGGSRMPELWSGLMVVALLARRRRRSRS